MRKSITFAMILTLPFFVSACDHQQQVCRPSSVRVDTSEPNRYWVCNEDGTEEKSVKSFPIGEPR